MAEDPKEIVRQIEDNSTLDVTDAAKLENIVLSQSALGDIMGEILRNGFGWDMENPSLKDTPARFVRYLEEFHQPIDLEEVLGGGFENPAGKSSSEMVVQSPIPFRMICEHHLLPAIGHAAIGYLPREKVVGLSKLTRLVQAVGTEKPSLQEAICHRIANLLDDHLQPIGVIVVLQAEHTCMACRGVNSPGVLTTTSAVRGVYRDAPHTREEFFNLVRLSK